MKIKCANLTAKIISALVLLCFALTSSNASACGNLRPIRDADRVATSQDEESWESLSDSARQIIQEEMIPSYNFMVRRNKYAKFLILPSALLTFITIFILSRYPELDDKIVYIPALGCLLGVLFLGDSQTAQRRLSGAGDKLTSILQKMEKYGRHRIVEFLDGDFPKELQTYFISLPKQHRGTEAVEKLSVSRVAQPERDDQQCGECL